MNKNKNGEILSLLLIALFSLSCSLQALEKKSVNPMELATGRVYYIGPQGKVGSDGSKENPFDLKTVFAGKAGVKPGDLIWLLAGIYNANGQYISTLKGTKEKPIIVRQFPGQRATLIASVLNIKGSDTIYWGFEARCLMNIFGPRTRMINLVVHRGSMGYGSWQPSVDSEVYGNIISDFGTFGKDRGHGHAFYTQNVSGTKRVVDNIMFAGFGWNIHNYTQAGHINGYHIEGNILFCAGMAMGKQDAPKDNMLISAYNPADRYMVIDNIAYHPRTGGWRPNVRFSIYAKEGNNIKATIKNNYFMGLKGLLIERWEHIESSGNEVWAPNVILETKLGKGVKKENWHIDNNTYHAQKDLKAFNKKDFETYKRESGFDANSTLLPTKNGHPLVNKVFVRANKYEKGRAHIAIFNWEGKDEVSVDISSAGIKKGKKFRILNVLTLFGKPTLEAVYDGKPIKIKMMKSKVAPDFDAFLLVLEKDFGAFAGRKDDPIPRWRKHEWKTMKYKAARSNDEGT